MSSQGLDDQESDATDERGFSVRAPAFVYKTVKAFLRLLCFAYFRVKVERADGIPDSGAVIVAPNHRSFIDFLVVGTTATRRKAFFMAKDDLWKSRILGSLLETFGAFPVNRAGADRLALDRARAVLEKGELLILFPEGTRRSGPKIEELHEGAAFLAARTGAPIVPVGVGGTSAAMPKGARLPHPVKVRLVVGSPIAAPERTGSGRVARSKVHAVTEQLRSELQDLYDRAESASKG
ncbi:MAG: lysophospholipid acyltransferase family protein [Acidimicrobiales bacterium]